MKISAELTPVGRINHYDDVRNANAWKWQEISGFPRHYGRSLVIDDEIGRRVITEYDLMLIDKLKTMIFGEGNAGGPDP